MVQQRTSPVQTSNPEGTTAAGRVGEARQDPQDLVGNAAIAASLAENEDAGGLPGLLGVAGRGASLDEAAAALVDALAKGDADAIRQALVDIEEALGVAEDEKDAEAIKRAGRILYANRKLERPADTDERYNDLLIRFSKHREERKAQEQMEQAEAARDERRAKSVTRFGERDGKQILKILDQREKHSDAWIAERGGKWTADLSVQYISEYPYTSAEFAAVKLADRHDNSVYFPDSDDDRLEEIWRNTTIRYVKQKEWTEQEKQETRAKNAALDRKYGSSRMMMTEVMMMSGSD
jgi:hypothetical protein